MNFFGFLCIIIPAMIIQYFISKNFETVAFKKGYDKSAQSFGMCFWFGIVGYLYVIALPNLNTGISDSEVTSTTNYTDEQKNLSKINKASDFNRYECKRIISTQRIKSGKCFMCGDDNEILKFYKITNDIGTREIPICDKCIQLFNDNCK